MALLLLTVICYVLHRYRLSNDTKCTTDSSCYAIKNMLCNMFVVIIYSLLVFAFCVVNARETDDSLSVLSLKFTSIFLSRCKICRKITNISRYRSVFPKRSCTLQLCVVFTCRYLTLLCEPTSSHFIRQG